MSTNLGRVVGTDGLDALVYNEIKSVTISPSTTSSTTFTASLSSFNRTPVVGDTCTVAWENTSTGESYLCVASCTALYEEQASMHIDSFVETTGEQGAGGANGADGADFPYETLTQDEYDALTTYEDKLYVIVEAVE